MNYCPRCGTRLEEYDTFKKCLKCGFQVNKDYSAKEEEGGNAPFDPADHTGEFSPAIKKIWVF